jgi:DNA-binding NarL/FixJ family response regulator
VSERIGVLIADDQMLVRAGLRMILELEPDIDIVGEVADGSEAVTMAAEKEPDVILMDVRMPHMDGLEATRRIVADRQHGARVLILTTFDHHEYVYESLRAGASGFVLKDIAPEQLVDAIHVIANGDALLSPDGHREADRAVRPTAARRRAPAAPELERSGQTGVAWACNARHATRLAMNGRRRSRAVRNRAPGLRRPARSVEIARR